MKNVYNISGLKVNVSNNQYEICNSYLIKSKKEMKRIIENLKKNYPTYDISKCSTFVLVSEWASHNLCYKLNILRSRTKDANLNTGKKWYINILYILCGMLYW